MTPKVLTFTLLTFTFVFFQAGAVSLSNDNQGQVLIFPYYTVNNDLNTVYSVVNLTAEPKALKVRFLEGENGLEVLNFNVYLAAHDVWNGVLVSQISNQPGHNGEASVKHITADKSCAPFLNKSGQDFVPFIIDNNPVNNNLRRATDGHIEVIELGVVTNTQNNSATAITPDNTGIPANCSQIEQAWIPNGYWDNTPNTDISNPTGGLFGTASIIDIPSGLSFGFNAVALKDFWSNEGLHSEPSSLQPNLASGSTESQIFLNNELQVSEWSTGFEAVSAVLMQSEIHNQYAYEADVMGSTEWVITFPTKTFHVNNFIAIPPFTNQWTGFGACDEFTFKIFDQEAKRGFTNGGIGPLPPQGANPSFCYQSNVFQFLEDSEPVGPQSKILGSDNLITFQDSTDYFNTPSGWANIRFDDFDQIMSPITGPSYRGLPAVGFQIHKTSNIAFDGLTAEYGSSVKHKGVLENQ